MLRHNANMIIVLPCCLMILTFLMFIHLFMLWFFLDGYQTSLYFALYIQNAKKQLNIRFFNVIIVIGYLKVYKKSKSTHSSQFLEIVS